STGLAPRGGTTVVMAPLGKAPQNPAQPARCVGFVRSTYLLTGMPPPIRAAVPCAGTTGEVVAMIATVVCIGVSEWRSCDGARGSDGSAGDPSGSVGCRSDGATVVAAMGVAIIPSHCRCCGASCDHCSGGKHSKSGHGDILRHLSHPASRYSTHEMKC